MCMFPCVCVYFNTRTCARPCVRLCLLSKFNYTFQNSILAGGWIEQAAVFTLSQLDPNGIDTHTLTHTHTHTHTYTQVLCSFQSVLSWQQVAAVQWNVKAFRPTYIHTHIVHRRGVALMVFRQHFKAACRVSVPPSQGEKLLFGPLCVHWPCFSYIVT